MPEGTIIKALSGFYYVLNGEGETVRCRARGKFRHSGETPLVGDRIEYALSGVEGIVERLFPRKNYFIRPPVANIDVMVIVASGAIPVTDPFLIDRMTVICEKNNCEPYICINKTDLESGDRLYDIYNKSGFKVFRVSAATGAGIEELKDALRDKVCAFTGNSGVGKSSLLNMLEPELSIPTGEVSVKLGRGRHTTRHVELIRLNFGAVCADTPGFSSFDTELMDDSPASELKAAFRDFRPFEGECRFLDCAHVKERGCAVLEAVMDGKIEPTRHESYVRLYEAAKQRKPWETNTASKKA